MKMTVEALEKELNTGKLKSLYFLYGEESYLLENAVKKIKKQFGEMVAGINYIVIDETNLEEIIPNLETPAFGYEKKMLVIKNSGLLKKDGKKKNTRLEQIREKVSSYLIENKEEIENYDILLFIEDEAGSNKLTKTIEEVGVSCNFERQKPQQLAKRLRAICQAYHVTIEDRTINYFLECCGTNMQDLINEIRKLIEYAGKGGKITKEAIDKLATKQIEAIIFDLTDNLGKKKIKEAQEVLKNLILTKEPIQKILITLYNHFKKLYFIKLADKYNKNIAESIKLKPNQMFLVNKYKMQAGYFKEKELRKLLTELSELDSNYKIGLIDLQVGLEAILCCYCS